MWNNKAGSKYFQVLEERKKLINHWKAIKWVKSSIKIKNIIKPKFLENNKKKEVSLKNNKNKIDYENYVLYGKIKDINTKKGRLNPNNIEKSRTIQPKNKNYSNNYKINLLKISNKKYKERLLLTKSKYSLNIFNKKINNDKKYKINLKQNYNNNYDFSKIIKSLNFK